MEKAKNNKTNVEQAIEYALTTINTLEIGSTFELRTVVCLKHLDFWRSLDDNELRAVGKEFKKRVDNGKIPNLQEIPKYTDRHNWYKKIK